MLITRSGRNFNEYRYTFRGFVKGERSLALEQCHFHGFRIDFVYHDAVHQIRLS